MIDTTKNLGEIYEKISKQEVIAQEQWVKAHDMDFFYNKMLTTYWSYSTMMTELPQGMKDDQDKWKYLQDKNRLIIDAYDDKRGAND